MMSKYTFIRGELKKYYLNRKNVMIVVVLLI